jgi:hypothetical protein
LSEVVSVDVSVDGFKKRAVFQALAGTTYQIAVDGYSAESGRDTDTETEDLFLISVHEVPANDGYADGTDLLDQALPISIAESTLHANSEFERGEPDHAFSIGENLASNSVWYFWTASAAGQVPVSLRNIDFGGVLAVYSVGEDSVLSEVGASDVIGDGLGESLSFSAVAGQEYAIAIDVFSLDGRDSGGGSFTLYLGEAPTGVVYAQWIDVGSLNIGGNTWVIEIQSVGAEARFGRLKVIDPSGM